MKQKRERKMRRLEIMIIWFCTGLFTTAPSLAQSTATLSGVVVDPEGGRVTGAQVLLVNSRLGFEREVESSAEGTFQFTNIPFQSYFLVVSKPGFATVEQSLSLRSNIPRVLTIELQLAQVTEALQVEAFSDSELVDPEETGTRMELSVARIEKMPIKVGNRGLESVLLSFPGFAANANGAIHPRGAHNQMTYVIDGMPISDQLTGSFATALDPSIVETLELHTGNIPPEFGNKVSGVANITTKSGLGSDSPFRGSLELKGAGFDTYSQATQFSGATGNFGYFGSVSLFKSNRFLDQVSLDNLHNGGNAERAFTRFDYQTDSGDQFRLNLMTGRTSFQVANLRSQHAAGQDQVRRLGDFSASLGWLHPIGSQATFDSSFSYRTSAAQLFPSPGDTPVTAAAARHLTTITTSNRLSVIRGAHTYRLGFDYQRIPLSENFSFAITSLDFNPPASDSFNRNLMALDLTRGGKPFHFSDKDSGSLWTWWAQDEIRLQNWMISLGLRYDVYRFLVDGVQLQPRVGLAYHLKPTGTVFRVSYNRTYQTPPNENLLLSNSATAAELVPSGVKEALGEGLIRIRPQRQNVYEAGLQQALGRHLSLNAVFYHKNSRDLQDNDNFFNTGIIFPTSLFKSRVNGVEMRANLLPLHNFSGSVSLTHARVVVTPPFTGGVFLGNAAVEALNSGPFIIDHDQALSVHGIVQYNFNRRLWTSWSIRHDSGLVSNPSDPEEVAADPDFSDLLPFVDLVSDPPRVNPRTIVDFALGYEHFSGDRRQWDLQFQISNLFDSTALFNFQSIFVGTRIVQPRTLGAQFRWHW